MSVSQGFDFQTFVKQNDFMLLFSGIASIIWLIFFSGYSKNGILGSTGYQIMLLISIGLTAAGGYGYMLNHPQHTKQVVKHHTKTSKANYTY
jgi:hypothetical protein